MKVTSSSSFGLDFTIKMVVWESTSFSLGVEFTREKADYFTFKVSQIGAQLDDLVLLLAVIKH